MTLMHNIATMKLQSSPPLPHAIR